jgi:hypothetical protein
MRIFLASIVAVMSMLRGSTVTHQPPQHPATAPCQEDQPCWNCETMGNHVCGRVNVELYDDHGKQWVRVWDEHNRIVFGPNLVESIEN